MKALILILLFSSNIMGQFLFPIKEDLKLGVFAYLTAPANTVIDTANVYRYIMGTFTNEPVEGFSLVETPAIKYDNGLNWFEIDWFATVSSSENNTTTSFAIRRGDYVLTQSIMKQYCKTAGELYNVSGTVVMSLMKDCEIQLIITADKICTLTLTSYTTTIQKFY